MPEAQRELSSRETATQDLIASQGPVQTMRQITDQMITASERELTRIAPEEARTDAHSWVTRANPNGVMCNVCGMVVGLPKVSGAPFVSTPRFGCKGRKGG